VYLTLALVWLALAAMLHLLYVNDPLAQPGGREQLGSWLAGLLCVYNAVRWILQRDAARRRAKGALARFESQYHRNAGPRERNPDFIFDEPPPDQIRERPRGE
jgi:hypothetical protein